MNTSTAELLPFPLTPSPMESLKHPPHGTASSFSCLLFQNILIYISPIKQDLGAASWLQLLLPLVHPLLTEVLGLAAWWGFCVHPEARGCSYICRTDSSLERFSAKLHKLCVRRGLRRDLLLPALCFWVVRTGGEICWTVGPLK